MRRVQQQQKTRGGPAGESRPCPLAALAFLEDQPALARLLLLEEPRLASSWCAKRLHEALDEVLQVARGEVIVGGEPAPSTALLAEVVVQALFSVLGGRVSAGDGRLVDLGVIENTIVRPCRWTLTPYGERALELLADGARTKRRAA